MWTQSVEPERHPTAIVSNSTSSSLLSENDENELSKFVRIYLHSTSTGSSQHKPADSMTYSCGANDDDTIVVVANTLYPWVRQCLQ